MFWGNIKFLLDSKDLTLKDLASNCMASYDAIRHSCSRNVTPSLELAYRMSKYLNVSLEYLLTGKTSDVNNDELTELRKAAQELKDLKAKLKELAQ